MTDTDFMLAALNEAYIAGADGEIPVGAVVVYKGKIIATGKNSREKNKNAIAHAEIEAINTACKVLGSWRLTECELYVTLEPCLMCAGAIVNARIKRVVFGAYDDKAGALVSAINLFDLPLNHKPQIAGGVMEKECSEVLSEFFEKIR